MNNMRKTFAKSKIVLIGDYGSGKTSFLRRLLFDSFEHGHIPTIGAAINGIMLDGTIYTFWDSAGQERYRSLVRLCYRQCHGVFIFYNMSDPSSHINIVNWIETLDNFIDESVPVVIIGSKSDMKISEEIDCSNELIADAITKINLVAKITLSSKMDSQEDILKKIKYSLEKAAEYAEYAEYAKTRDDYECSEDNVKLEDDGYFERFKKHINSFTYGYCTM
jgi:small GTP-binding protein